MPSPMFRRFVLPCLICCCCFSTLMLGNTVAQAATATVTTLADHDDGVCNESDCTLREALAYSPAGSTVTFAPDVTGTITLSSSLKISSDVTVSGPTASGVIISGNDAVPVLSVTGGTVTLQNLTLAHGLGGSSGAGGLKVSGSSTLTLSGCTIAYNKGGKGKAGTSGSEGSVTAGGAGGAGGIKISDSASVKIINSTLANNVGGAGGHGGYNAIWDEAASGGVGGTGAVNVAGGTLNLASSTIASNTGGAGGKKSGMGGSSWEPSPGAGGLALEGGIVSISDTIIAGNKGAVQTYGSPSQTATGVANVEGVVQSGGYNLIGDADGNLDPQLGPLQDNGGPTQTMALLTNSPAINGGDPDFDAALVPYDQRGEGYPRIFGSCVDIGAYELQTVPPPPTNTPTPLPTSTPTPLPTSTPTPTATPVPVTLSGKVYNAVALSTLGGITVTALQADGTTVAAQTLSGTDGSYTLSLPSGTYSLRATKASDATFRLAPAFTNPITITTAATGATSYDFRALGIGGRVITPNNVGVSGVTLNLYAGSNTTITSTLTSDVNGFFSFDGLVAGTWKVVPTVPATYTYTPTAHTLVLADEALFTSFTATRTGTVAQTLLSGKVYNAVALNGLSGIVVSAVKIGTSTVAAQTTTDSNGNYSLTLRVGTYTLSAYYPAAPTTFPIVAAFTNPVTVSTTNLAGYNFRCVGIGGRVISPNNIGLSGVVVNLYGKSDTGLKKVLRTVTTDGNGFFSFDGIVPGIWNVVPKAPTTYTYTPTTRLLTVSNAAVFTSFTAKP